MISAPGVFRDNVLTGRSRTALFLSRIPAALAVCLTVTALGFAIGLAATFGFAGGLPTPSVSLILESVAWLALANSVVCVIAIGVGVADRLSARHDHGSDRLAVRVQPAARPVHGRSARCATACSTA